MTKYFSLVTCSIFSIAALLLSAAPASAVTIDSNNHRHFYMTGSYTNHGGSENITFYAVHSNRQEGTLIGFDLSGYTGDTALGDATMSLTVTAGGGNVGTGAYDMEIRQLNTFNADVNLDNAGQVFKNATGSVPWKDNAGVDLANLNFSESVLAITNGLITTTVGPIAGDDGGSPTPGTVVDFIIPQATLQTWLDGTAPSIVALNVHRTGPNVDYIQFHNTGTGEPLPTLTFETGAVPEPSSFALAGLGLLGLVGWGIRRRRQG